MKYQSEREVIQSLNAPWIVSKLKTGKGGAKAKIEQGGLRWNEIIH